jgi:methyl-accepting chemotaxis protein
MRSKVKGPGTPKSSSARGRRSERASAVKAPAGGRRGSAPAKGRAASKPKPDAERPSRSAKPAEAISAAFEVSSHALMIVDRERVIRHLNPAAQAMMERHEAELKAVIPSFAARSVVGSSLDVFCAGPSEPRLFVDPSKAEEQVDLHFGRLLFAVHVSAMRDSRGGPAGALVEWQEVSVTRGQQREVNRLQQAVQAGSTAMMLVDRDLNITFVNTSTRRLLGRRSAELRAIYPGFDAEKMIGANIDMFHKNPAHQRRMLADPKNLPHQADIKVGPLTFRLKVDAIRDPQGEYIGNILEWDDVTEQVDAEKQIASLIKDASSGDLNHRLRTETWEGSLRRIGDGVNQMLEAMVEPVRAATEAAKRLAEGDLTRGAEGEFHGEFGVLVGAVNESIAHLEGTVGEILHGARDIANAASEINDGNTHLASRTQEQSSALEETAATIEELTSTVRRNADNARFASDLAQKAASTADKGGSVVQQAVVAMGAINSSSKRIAEIIGVIDEIAFQTNLLALNAAVEAARAGEQGRGFAVVAAEVRNLAQRSASAAKEIKQLIRDSSEKVAEGSELVNRSGASLTEIVDSVKQVNELVAQISSASQEQATGIEQVNKAVAQMDETTQQNAALVEEAAASSSTLATLAKELDALMRFFRINEQESAPKSAGAHGKQPQAAPAKAAAARPAPRAAAPRAPRPAPSGADWEVF